MKHEQINLGLTKIITKHDALIMQGAVFEQFLDKAIQMNMWSEVWGELMWVLQESMEDYEA